MISEIVVELRENAGVDLVEADGMKVILRSGYGQEKKNHVVEEKRGDDDERVALKRVTLYEIGK